MDLTDGGAVPPQDRRSRPRSAQDALSETNAAVQIDTSPALARTPRRARYVVAGVLCLGAIGFLIFGGLNDNIVYFRTVSEAVADRADADGRFRMAGTVVAGSVTRADGGVAFTVTEGGESADVFHRGDPPELFAADVPVVCEGRWNGARFESDRIMIKHGSTYQPPPGSGSGS